MHREGSHPVKRSRRLNVGSLFALRAGGDVEGHALVLGQRLEASSVNSREVRKQVFDTAVWCNEPKAFCIIKPFHNTACHILFPKVNYWYPCWYRL